MLAGAGRVGTKPLMAVFVGIRGLSNTGSLAGTGANGPLTPLAAPANIPVVCGCNPGEGDRPGESVFVSVGGIDGEGTGGAAGTTLEGAGADGGRFNSAIFCRSSNSFSNAAVVEFPAAVLGRGGGLVAVVPGTGGSEGGAGAGGAEAGAAGGVTAATGEIGFVELGLGVQASSSNPLTFVEGADVPEPVSIRFGDGVLLLLVALVGVPSRVLAFASMFSSTLILVDFPLGVGLPRRIVLSFNAPLGAANRFGGGEVGFLCGNGPGGGGGCLPVRIAS